jgi:hypothetical protein
LSGAIQQTLSTAFPKANLNIAISSALKLAYQDAGIHQSLEQYAGYINNLSQSILGVKNYPGIHITSVGTALDVWDGTASLGDDVIDYKDLIGQPTWIEVNMVSVKVVLRGGLKPGMFITLPQTLVNFAGADAGMFSSDPGVDQRTHISLPGRYQIHKLLHIGDLRNPDGASWSTNIEAIGNVSAGDPPPADTTPPQDQPQHQVEPVIKIRPVN